MNSALSFRRLLLTALVIIGLAGGAHQVAAQSTPPPTIMQLAPASVTVTADRTVAFAVTSTTGTIAASDVTKDASFSSDNPRSSFTGNIFHPGQAGTWQVVAVYRGLTAAATVIVTAGQPYELVINPNSDPETITLNRARRFTAQVFDQANNPVPDPDLHWSLIGPIGTIDQAGLLTTQSVGPGKVQAQVGQLTGQVAVIVKEPEPAPATNTAVTPAAPVGPTNTAAAPAPEPVKPSALQAAPLASSVSKSSAAATQACRTLKPFLWILIAFLFLTLIALVYALIPVYAVWPVILALVMASILIGVNRELGCRDMPWWSWVIALGTIGLTVVAIASVSQRRRLMNVKPEQPPGV